MSSGFPRITFGMIVLNGEPFLRHNLRALYPFAHQIIVVEGASPLAAHAATAEGHSTDTTLETLARFKQEDDPDNKLIVVTAENEGHQNGFWPGEKDEQSRAYARRATGEWLWQIDVDEFYHQEDMQAICRHLIDRNPSMVFFYLRSFMYHPKLEVLGVEPEYNQSQPIPRLFKWGDGYQYVTHRPPTVVNEKGEHLKSLNAVCAEESRRYGWFIWHYPYLFRHQFRAKAEYYDRQPFRVSMSDWAVAAENVKRPRFSVLWRGLSWLSLLREDPPGAVISAQADSQDYSIPAYVHRPAYQCLAATARLYVALLRISRVRVLSKRWFTKTYSTRPSEIDKPLRQHLGRRARLNQLGAIKLARYLGLIGYRPF